MTFLEKYALLKKSVPVPAVSIAQRTENCSYVDYTYSSKDCYYCFDSVWLVGGMYTYVGWGDKLVDCYAVTESELCYQCIDSNKCYNSTYLLNCNESRDCHFSAFLNSCTDCFGCVALSHKKYCIFNKQYTKEDYFEKIKELKSINSPEELLQKMLDIKRAIPHPASQQFNNQNCAYGDFVYGSKNCYWSFHTYFAENSGYSFESGIMNNCWDMYMAGGNMSGGLDSKKGKCELCYEMMDSDLCYNCAFIIGCSNSTNCFYSSDLRNCTDCFGCVGLTNKKYCILNNQLTKEQYFDAVKKIKKELGWKVE